MNADERASLLRSSRAADADSTLEKRVSRTEEYIREVRNIAVTALILALLLSSAYVATSIVFFPPPSPPPPVDLSGFNATLQMLQTRLSDLNMTLQPRVSMVEAQLLEILMMTTPTPFRTTVIRNGTFYWGANGAVGTTTCYDDPDNDYPCDWQNDGDEASEPSLYEVQTVEIGPLNLTVLVLGPTPGEFSISQLRVFPPPFVDMQFNAYKFNPPIPDFIGLRADNEFAGFTYLQLTAYNAQRFSASSGCLETKQCIINGNNIYDDGHSKNTLRLGYGISRRYGSMYVTGWLQGDASVLQYENFAVQSPLHLLLPAA